MKELIIESRELKEKGNSFLKKALSVSVKETQFEIFQKAMSCYH